MTHPPPPTRVGPGRAGPSRFLPRSTVEGEGILSMMQSSLTFIRRKGQFLHTRSERNIHINERLHTSSTSGQRRACRHKTHRMLTGVCGHVGHMVSESLCHQRKGSDCHLLSVLNPAIMGECPLVSHSLYLFWSQPQEAGDSRQEIPSVECKVLTASDYLQHICEHIL